MNCLTKIFICLMMKKLYYEEKQKFEEKTEGVINRYVAKINDEIHEEYIHAVRQEYSSR